MWDSSHPNSPEYNDPFQQWLETAFIPESIEDSNEAIYSEYLRQTGAL